MSILPSELRTFDYYVKKLPLYLQNSYGFIEHYRIWYDLMIANDSKYTGIVPIAETILYLLNIFDKDYLDNIVAMGDAEIPTDLTNPQDKYGRQSDILDKIGALFGITRNFTCTYLLNNVTQSKQVSLNNYDFLILIKVTMVKSYFDGTYEQWQSMYDDIGFTVVPVSSVDDPATCIVYLIQTESTQYSEDILALFLSELLFIESVGIRYIPTIVDIANLLIWDGTDEASYWDEGKWSL